MEEANHKTALLIGMKLADYCPLPMDRYMTPMRIESYGRIVPPEALLARTPGSWSGRRKFLQLLILSQSRGL
jgi:hypothetical protein